VPNDVPYPAGLKDTLLSSDNKDVKIEEISTKEEVSAVEAEVSESKVEAVANVKEETLSDNNQIDDNNEKEN